MKIEQIFEQTKKIKQSLALDLELLKSNFFRQEQKKALKERIQTDLKTYAELNNFLKKNL